jgi:hypothetical protein
MAELQCNSCIFYNEGFDDTNAAYDDTIVVDASDTEYHYCPMYMYPEHIPSAVREGTETCKYYTKAP